MNTTTPPDLHGRHFGKHNAAHDPVRRDDVPVFDCSSGDPVKVA